MNVTLMGEVERVTFENEETGFRVLRLGKVEGLGKTKRMTVVGILAPVGPGTKVRVSGRVEEDARHGQRVRADSLVVVAPDTLEGLERYLASGAIDGLGPGFAKRIVGYFGLETLTVLDTASHRLAEVKGLGAARVTRIRKAWDGHRQLSNVLLALEGHGVSAALAQRIVTKFGERAVEVVLTAPYRLALEVPNIGFKTADAIARARGLSLDHPERVEAGVVHQLREWTDRGHSRAPRELLVLRSAEMLGIDPAFVEAATDRLFAAEKVVIEDDDVYPARLHEAERKLASRVQSLLGAPRAEVQGFGERLAKFEAERGIVLADAQRRAVEAAVREKVLVITGGPGVGKTTIVQAILNVLSGAKLRTALAAPTGRAAKRLTESTGHEATTLHRLLEVNAHTGRFERTRENPLEIDLLVVDEVSMLDLRLAESLFDAIPNAARVVLVGDVDQLPSVGAGAVLADLIQSGVVPVVRLDVVFRQAESSGIVRASHAILRGEEPRGADRPDGDFFVIVAKTGEHAEQLIVELVTERIPKRFGFDPRREVQVLTPMHRGAAGTERLNARLQSILCGSGPSIASGETVFRLGDKVIQTKNDYDKGVFNGDIGEVVGLDHEDHGLSVSFGEGDSVAKYERGELGQLALSYAMSIHKSQGSEYPAVVVPMLRGHFVMLSRNLLYTAVTRSKKLCVVVTEPRALSIALGETRKEQRMTGLARRLIQSTSGEAPARGASGHS